MITHWVNVLVTEFVGGQESIDARSVFENTWKRYGREEWHAFVLERACDFKLERIPLSERLNDDFYLISNGIFALFLETDAIEYRLRFDG